MSFLDRVKEDVDEMAAGLEDKVFFCLSPIGSSG